MNATTQPQKSEAPGGEDVTLLLARAEKGDPAVLLQLRKLLDDSPDLWQSYGNLAAQAKAGWVQLAAGTNLLLGESLMRKAAEVQKEVAGASPSPLEQLLAERITICWLQVSFYDALLAQTRESTPAKVRLLQQQQDAAHRRYLTAVKTLATVRKLVAPVRSPVEIATQLEGQRSGLRLRQGPVAEGMPVDN